jgi:hypothetical protein
MPSIVEIWTARTLKGLVHQGGLRARIVTEGRIRVGDVVSVPALGSCASTARHPTGDHSAQRPPDPTNHVPT